VIAAFTAPFFQARADGGAGLDCKRLAQEARAITDRPDVQIGPVPGGPRVPAAYVKFGRGSPTDHIATSAILEALLPDFRPVDPKNDPMNQAKGWQNSIQMHVIQNYIGRSGPSLLEFLTDPRHHLEAAGTDSAGYEVSHTKFNSVEEDDLHLAPDKRDFFTCTRDGPWPPSPDCSTTFLLPSGDAVIIHVSKDYLGEFPKIESEAEAFLECFSN
jgi:hypothetical protein